MRRVITNSIVAVGMGPPRSLSDLTRVRRLNESSDEAYKRAIETIAFPRLTCHTVLSACRLPAYVIVARNQSVPTITCASAPLQINSLTRPRAGRPAISPRLSNSVPALVSLKFEIPSRASSYPPIRTHRSPLISRPVAPLGAPVQLDSVSPRTWTMLKSL